MRLELDAITAAYGDTVAVRDVSLVVPASRVVALIGANGAGKTTLLSVASGLLRPRSGRVLLEGEEVTGSGTDRLARMGLCHITESRSVFPSLTVADNLRMFATRQGEADALERAVSAFPRLGERLGQLAGTLSSGEQQMLALARAYAQQARLIMLDEVSMGLAPVIVDEIFAFLARLAAEGQSLLIVEQYVAKALALADFVYVLVRGRLAFAGETSEAAGVDIVSHYLGSDSIPV